MKINSHNEWDRLREVIVGRAESVAALVFPTAEPIPDEIRQEAFALALKAYPQYFLDEVNEDLEELCAVLKQFGAKVLRPSIKDINKIYTTPFWSAAGNNVSNMRDLHLVVGNTVIESPSHERHRLFEPLGLYEIWYDYFEDGFRWIAAPKPRLAGDYRAKIPFYENGRQLTRLAESEIMFEAANTVRMGKDLLYLVSSSGNYLGAKWLQGVLGESYRVHTTEEIYRSSHIDSTALCLRPGLVLLNGYRVNEQNCPKIFDKWQKIYFQDIRPYRQETIDFQQQVRRNVSQSLRKLGVESNIEEMSTEWIGMNVLSLDPNTVVVDKTQVRLIETLETLKLTVVPISFRHAAFMGGIHCSTLDTVRESKLESYFE